MVKVSIQVMSDSPADEIFLARIEAFFNNKHEIELLQPSLRLDQWENLRYTPPDVVLVDDSQYNGVPILDVIRRLDREYPSIALMVVLHEETEHHDSINFHRQLIQIGAMGVLTYSSQVNFQHWVVPIQTAHDKKVRSLSPNRAFKGELFTVHSLKGGVGRTAISSNLAAALANNNKRVLFIDFNWPYGGSNAFLDYTPARSVLDLLHAVNSLRPENVQIATVKHATIPNLDIISTPLESQHVGYLADMLQPNIVLPRHDEATERLLEQINNHNLTKARQDDYDLLQYIVRKAKAKQAIVQLSRRLLEVVSYQYDYIVVDAPARLDEEVLTVIGLSKAVLYVTTPDVPSVQALRTALNILPDFVPDYQSKVKLILNRVRKKSLEDLPAEKLYDIFDLPWLSSLPDEPKMANWINSSELAIDMSRKSPFVEAIQKVADELSPERTLFNDLSLSKRRLGRTRKSSTA